MIKIQLGLVLGIAMGKVQCLEIIKVTDIRQVELQQL